MVKVTFDDVDSDDDDFDKRAVLQKISYAIEMEDDSTALNLLKRYPDIVNADQSSLQSPLLHYAAYCGRKQVVDAFLEAGALVNARGRYRETALHCACIENNREIVQALIDYGADINAQDEEHKTPLHLVLLVTRVNVNMDLVQCLLENGADLNLKDDEGKTTEDLARTFDDPLIIEMLENPPPLLEAVPRRKDLIAFAKLGLDNNMRDIHDYFKGFLWPTQSDSLPTIGDLMYENKTSSLPAAKRWIHLPLNNPKWLQLVAQNIVSTDYEHSSSEVQIILDRVREFIDQHFPQTGEGSTGVKGKTFPGDDKGQKTLKLLSLVVPTLDIELEDGARTMLGGQASSEVSKLEETGKNDKEDKTHGDHDLLLHVQRMDEVNTSYSKLGIQLQSPCSIYEPHSSSGLSKFISGGLERRIMKQVLFDYLQSSKDQIANRGASKKILPHALSSQNRRKSSNASNIDGSHGRDRRESLFQPSSLRQNEPGSRAEQVELASVLDSHQHRVAPASSIERKAGNSRPQGIVIAQLWMLMIYVEGPPGPESKEGKWIIITAFPERWNPGIAPTFLITMKNALYPMMRGLKVATVEKFVKQILDECVNFVEETFDLSRHVTYSNVFATKIARISNDLADRYEDLKEKTSSLIKNELHIEVEQLKSIDDITYEIDAIKRLLKEQEHIVDQFEKEFRELFPPHPPFSHDPANHYVHPALNVFDQLGLEAKRVRESLVTLLDLKQRFATIEDARLTSNQTTILIIFTIATVVFSPLLFTVTILALKIDGLPDTFGRGYVVKACVSGLAITIGVILICLGGYWTYLYYRTQKEDSFKASRERRKTAPKSQAIRNPPDAVVGESSPSWQTALSRKSKQLVGDLKLRIPWRHKSLPDEEIAEEAAEDKGKEKGAIEQVLEVL